MSIPVEQLPDDPETLKKLILQLQGKINFLEEQFRLARHEQFAAKTIALVAIRQNKIALKISYCTTIKPVAQGIVLFVTLMVTQDTSKWMVMRAMSKRHLY